jgi:GrpB-like predicted nucleotidyltransferase (UPF0157 family)
MAEEPRVTPGSEAWDAALRRARANGVSLVPYDPEWPSRYETASGTILAACGGIVVRIDHIGSTSIPGIGAKPYIDLMPGLRLWADGPRIVPAMEALGYEYRGEYGVEGRHYFTKFVDGDEHVWKHNVHCYEIGHREWQRHLVFRDALRADVGLRDEYWRLKQDLAAQYPDDVERYAIGKSAFVERVIAAHGGPSRA